MRPLRTALVVLAVNAAYHGRASAQVADPENCVVEEPACAQGCGCNDEACVSSRCGQPFDGSTSDADRAAAQAQAEARVQAQIEDAERTGEVEQQRALRRANDRGLAAAAKHDWRLAISDFEVALALDPSNQLIAENLRQVREKIAAEDVEIAALRALSAGPRMPVPTPDAFTGIAAQMPSTLPASTDQRGFIESSLAYARAHGTEQVVSAAQDAFAVEDVATVTPTGLFLRVHMNIVKVATVSVPDWLTRAASGEMTPQEAASLPMLAGSMIFNVGVAPGEWAEHTAEIASGRIAAAEAAATEAAKKGIAAVVAVGAATILRPSGVGEDAYLFDKVTWAELKKEFEKAGTTVLQLQDHVAGLVKTWTTAP